MSFCKQQLDSRMGASKQSGFVLVLALIILSVLTVIGVSSMNSANMELRSAANAQHHHIAFNASQSILEYAISEPAEGVFPELGQINWQVTDPPLQTPDVAVVPVLNNLPRTSELAATVTWVGCSTGLGSSMQANRGLSNNFYTVATSAANSSGTATSLQSMGIRYPAAACPL